MPYSSLEVVLSMERMNKVLEFDPVQGIITCEAGIVLEQADEYLKPLGFLMPLDLGAKGNCQVGGVSRDMCIYGCLWIEGVDV